MFLGEERIGRVQWWETGGKTVIHASCPLERDRIYRLVLRTDDGETRLGVMLPRDQTFLLQKVISSAVVPRRGLVDRTLPGEEHIPGAPLAFSAFAPAETGLMQRIRWNGKADDLRSAVWDGTVYLLCPFAYAEECGLAHLLFLARPVREKGSLFAMIPLPDSPEEDRFRKKNALE